MVKFVVEIFKKLCYYNITGKKQVEFQIVVPETNCIFQKGDTYHVYINYVGSFFCSICNR